jgi:hypothetical protein
MPDSLNRFGGFQTVRETAEAVHMCGAPKRTPLKRLSLPTFPSTKLEDY